MDWLKLLILILLAMSFFGAGGDALIEEPTPNLIAFISNRDYNYEVYVMDPEGGNVRRLTDNSWDDYGPAWSPDGQWIAFYSKKDGDNEVCQ